MTRKSFIPTLAAMSDKDFDKFSLFIHSNLGIKMPPQKKSMLEARLRKRLRALGMASFEEYREYFFSDEGMPKEIVSLCDVVTTNKTDFFREPAHFDYMTRAALPDLIQRGLISSERPLKLWSAGCSSGEEPYTLSMVLSEYAANEQDIDFSILGTDLSSRVLERAVNGIYSMERIAPVSDSLRRKYLLRSKNRDEELVRLVPELRARMRFRRLNFMDDDYGLDEKFQMIYCRNVIIYFDRPTQTRIVGNICRHLVTDGYIFMGHSETLNGMGLPLKQVAPSVYQRIPGY